MPPSLGIEFLTRLKTGSVIEYKNWYNTLYGSGLNQEIKALIIISQTKIDKDRSSRPAKAINKLLINILFFLPA
jgi:hypothetical protein